MPISRAEAAVLEQFLVPARATVTPQAWEADLAAGCSLTQQQPIAVLLSPARHSTCPPDTTNGSRKQSPGQAR